MATQQEMHVSEPHVTAGGEGPEETACTSCQRSLCAIYSLSLEARGVPGSAVRWMKPVQTEDKSRLNHLITQIEEMGC